jgi:hypothetical protein
MKAAEIKRLFRSSRGRSPWQASFWLVKKWIAIFPGTHPGYRSDWLSLGSIALGYVGKPCRQRCEAYSVRESDGFSGSSSRYEGRLDFDLLALGQLRFQRFVLLAKVF